VLPRIILWGRGGRCHVTAIAPAAELPGLLRAATGAADRLPKAPAGSDPGPGAQGAEQGAGLALVEDREGWDRAMSRALAAIERGRLQKVVMARAIDVALPAAPDLGRLLSRLRRDSPAGLTFFLRGAGAAFAGATPETLCRVEGRSLAS
jgi:isochorismate synthase EntC